MAKKAKKSKLSKEQKDQQKKDTKNKNDAEKVAKAKQEWMKQNDPLKGKPAKLAQPYAKHPNVKMVKVKGLVYSSLKDGYLLKKGEVCEISEAEYKRLQNDPRGLKYCELVK